MAIITGTSGDDSGAKTLSGTNVADEIYGRGGNDTLIGFDGNDVLEGGAGGDELFGSAGFNYASYRSSDGGVNVDLANFGFGGGHAEGDMLFNIQGVIGSTYGDLLFGGDERNVLRGEAGNDILVGMGGDDRLEGGNGNDFLTGGADNDELRGGAGIDTANFGVDSAEYVLADLASGTASGAGVGNDHLFGIENLVGTDGDDGLRGNNGANVLEGSFLADDLAGRGGADRFDYNFTDDSNPKAPDTILDFSRVQGDKIDLADIDANDHANGNQAFWFIGHGQFTDAGQVRFFQQTGDTYVEVNTSNATAGGEAVIVLDGLVSLQAIDFAL